jgi:hypothetical protein
MLQYIISLNPSINFWKTTAQKTPLTPEITFFTKRCSTFSLYFMTHAHVILTSIAKNSNGLRASWLVIEAGLTFVKGSTDLLSGKPHNSEPSTPNSIMALDLEIDNTAINNNFVFTITHFMITKASNIKTKEILYIKHPCMQFFRTSNDNITNSAF